MTQFRIGLYSIVYSAYITAENELLLQISFNLY